MDRLIVVVLLFNFSECAYYNKNSDESQHLSSIYFGYKCTIRFYVDVVKDYGYWKVYDRVDKELFEVHEERLLELGIDSLKGDTLFAYQFNVSRNDIDSKYQLIDSSFLKIFSRKIFQFGAINSKTEIKSYLGKKGNCIYFKNNEKGIIDAFFRYP